MTYTCAVCLEECISGRSDEEAQAELADVFPGYTPDDCVIVCYDCYERMGLKEKPDAP